MCIGIGLYRESKKDIRMKQGTLIPGVSTHFICRKVLPNVFGTAELTKGRVYEILKWNGNIYLFLDDRGSKVEWMGELGIEDCTYSKNIEKIMEGC